MFDLGIINGRVYFGKEYRVTNVYVKAGKIAEISKELFECERVLDATKKIVLPGFIDSHVHFALKVGEFESADDFESGSKTAAYGGITTFLDFTDPIFHHDEFRDALEKRKKEAENACIDYSFHATVGDFKGDPDVLKILCKAEGINSIKVFTTYSESNRRCSYEMIEKLFDEEMTLMAHCEEEDLLKKRWESPATYEKARPVMAERSAAMHMADIAERRKSRLYIVHISSGSTLDMIKLKHPAQIGKSIFLESCPHYFYLSDVKLSNIDGNLYLLTPPLRGGKELMRLRSSIGLIDTISTDHCPFMSEEKMKYDMAYQVPMGIGGVEHSFPLMFNLFGDAIIPKFTSKPAEIFGLKNKGEIKVGKDADLVIFDSSLSNTIKESHSKADYTVYEGLKIRGKISATISRGHIVMENDQFFGGQGQFIRR